MNSSRNQCWLCYVLEKRYDGKKQKTLEVHKNQSLVKITVMESKKKKKKKKTKR